MLGKMMFKDLLQSTVRRKGDVRRGFPDEASVNNAHCACSRFLSGSQERSAKAGGGFNLSA